MGTNDSRNRWRLNLSIINTCLTIVNSHFPISSARLWRAFHLDTNRWTENQFPPRQTETLRLHVDLIKSVLWRSCLELHERACITIRNTIFTGKSSLHCAPAYKCVTLRLRQTHKQIWTVPTCFCLWGWNSVSFIVGGDLLPRGGVSVCVSVCVCVFLCEGGFSAVCQWLSHILKQWFGKCAYLLCCPEFTTNSVFMQGGCCWNKTTEHLWKFAVVD